jgi:hypothetical protein
MAVSDAPFTFDKERWRAALLTMTIDGKHVVTIEDKADEEFLADMLAVADSIRQQPPSAEGLEGRESVLTASIAAGGHVITDDNMLPEWRQVLRFQSPP